MWGMDQSFEDRMMPSQDIAKTKFNFFNSPKLKPDSHSKAVSLMQCEHKWYHCFSGIILFFFDVMRELFNQNEWGVLRQ